MLNLNVDQINTKLEKTKEIDESNFEIFKEPVFENN